MDINRIKNDFNNVLFLNELVCFLIDKYDLNDYVRNINIKDTYNKNCNGIYVFNKLDLNLYLESIRMSFSSLNYYVYRLNRDTLEYNDLYSSFLLDNILHEISHVSQYKEYNSDIDDSLHKVISDSFKYTLSNNKMLCRFLLLERNANINAKKLLYELVKEYDLYSDVFTNNINRDYIKLLNSSYMFICPCKRYYLLNGKLNEYNSILFDEEYENDIRKSWGLPLIKKYHM